MDRGYTDNAMMGKTAQNLLVYVMTCLVIPFAFVEALLLLMLYFPSIAPPALHKVLKSVYSRTVRTVQYDPQCAQYDPQVAYTLKPGQCSFETLLFRSTLSINSAGVRDDEESLQAPDVIVAGDSYAMGWGVAQGQTYAELIQKQTKLKVLNTGISSYGTVREMLLLRRMDLSRLKYLVIHYDGNDYDENRAYYIHQNKLPIMGPSLYQRLADQVVRKGIYYPGQYVLTALKQVVDPHWGGMEIEVERKVRMDAAGQANDKKTPQAMFLNALVHAAPEGIEKARLIVVVSELNFVDELRKELRKDQYPDHIKNAVVRYIPISREGRYVFDGHFNAKGHEIFARKIIELMRL